jgi:hypothetical protein
VERLVSQRVDEELRWLRANLPELVASVLAQPAAENTDTASNEASANSGHTTPVADDVQMD